MGPIGAFLHGGVLLGRDMQLVGVKLAVGESRSTQVHKPKITCYFATLPESTFKTKNENQMFFVVEDYRIFFSKMAVWLWECQESLHLMCLRE